MASLGFLACTSIADLPSTSAVPFRGSATRRKCPSRWGCVRAQETGDTPAQVAQEKAAPPAPAARPKKPVFSLKKGQIVRVDKEKYLNSINYLSVGHPPYFKGLDYIYEDRGEVLDLKIFETGEYALIAWVGIPTAPAWLPTDMLIKSEKLNYERM